MHAATTSTLRGTIKDQIGSFLFQERFATNEPMTQAGLLNVINLISDYKEEGKALYPEVLVTNDLDLLRSIPAHKIFVGQHSASEDNFKKIIKSCAPLSSSEWVIFIEIKEGQLRYGVMCAEITETTPSLYDQTVGELKLDIPGCTVAYVRPIGAKSVELKGLRSSITVSLSLDDPSQLSANETTALCKHICYRLPDELKQTAINYFDKILTSGLKDGHGNLIGVIDNTPEALRLLQTEVPDGIFLPIPIDMCSFLTDHEAEKSSQSTTILRQHALIVKAMINNDGIAIFTSDGKLIGYHFILNKMFLTQEQLQQINGGARTRTYYNMIESKVFTYCFIKSQDGPVKTFSIYEQ